MSEQDMNVRNERSPEIAEAILTDLVKEGLGPDAKTPLHAVWVSCAVRKQGKHEEFAASLSWAERQGYLRRAGEAALVLSAAGYERGRSLQEIPVSASAPSTRRQRRLFDFLP